MNKARFRKSLIIICYIDALTYNYADWIQIVKQNLLCHRSKKIFILRRLSIVSKELFHVNECEKYDINNICYEHTVYNNYETTFG